MRQLKNFVHLLKIVFMIIPFLVSTACTPTLPSRKKIKPGTYLKKVDITFRGSRRNYRIHIPAGFQSDRTYPLVLVIHGAFSNAKEFEQVSGFSALADEEDFIVAYPNGVGLFGYLQHWNGGHCCGMAAEKKLDDVGFLNTVIDDIKQQIAIKPDQIFLVGFSNGGMLGYRYASEFPDNLAAFASVSTSIGSSDSDRDWQWTLNPPKTPVPVLIAHGTADESIPYSGGKYKESNSTLSFFSVEESVSFWRKANQCNERPDITLQKEGAVTIQQWEDCSSNMSVRFYKLNDWNHRWPGLHHTSLLPENNPLKDYDLTGEIWKFFNDTITSD